VPAVLDASAIGDFLRGVRRDLPKPPLHVPALCDVEFVSHLRRLLRLGRIGEERAAELVGLYLALPLTRYRHEPLRVLELRENFSAYDATYVALAEQLALPLLTADTSLIRAVRQYVPGVRLVES
jgi:predicted nucleic acid-binding protein